MKKILIFIVLYLLLNILFSQNLYNLQTDDLNFIYYSNAHSYIVPHLARCYQRTWNYYQDFWDFQPRDRTTMFLEDFSDWANGGATAVPKDFVYISMSPYMYIFDVSPASERMSLLMHHELTHVFAMDMSASSDKVWRKVFGGKIQQSNDNPVSLLYAYLSAPRKFSPRWYHEGIAVNMETWMSGGIGRAMGAYDEMVFRSMILSGSKIYDIVGLEAEGTAIDFQVGANSYLYGTRFFSYLSYQYGPRKLISWVRRNDDSYAYFSDNFEHIYEKPLRDEWKDWISFEKNFQQGNLERIRENQITSFVPVLSSAMGSVSRSFISKDKSTLYTAVKYPGELPHILSVNLKNGEKKKICKIKGASTYYTTSMVYIEDTEELVFTTDNFYRRDLNSVEIKSGKVSKLITDLRAGELALNKMDKSIWGVRHENGISTLIQLKEPYSDWNAVYAFPYGQDCYDLDISPDGKYMTAAVTNVNGSQELALFELENLIRGNAEYRSIFDFDYTSPSNFVFSEDGRYLFGSSYYTGVSNIYRYDFELDDMSIITNCETGMFRPVPVSKDSLIAFQYLGGKGWQPGWIKNQALDTVSSIEFLGQKVIEKYPYVKGWDDGSPADIDIDKCTTYKGTYRMIKNLQSNGFYPIIQGYKDHTAIGYHFELQDAIGFLNLKLNVSYSPDENLDDEEKYHLDSEVRYKFTKIYGSYNKADFYDLFGPVKTSRKGYSYGITYSKSLIYDKPREFDIEISAAGYGGLETMPEFQNVSAEYEEMYHSNIQLDYSFVQRSLGGVDDEEGYSISGDLSSSLVNEKLYPGASLSVSGGLELPIAHCSIWSRNYAGYNFSEENSSFTKNYFGGFGNNWVDRGSIKRYREMQSFPGLEINEAAGKSFVKSLLEVNLPPLRFSDIGATAFYARWLRTSIFGGVLFAENTDESIDRYYTAGFQSDVRFISLSLMKTTLSLGGAIAYDENNNEQTREIMISLRLF